MAALLCHVLPLLLHAQEGRSSVYPSELYPGENVITIKNSGGIDKIRVRSTAKSMATIPPISGCPTSVNIHVRVDDATTNEEIDLTVYDCGGAFATIKLATQNWKIRREYTGRVMVGRDTCVQCEIVTSEMRLVDSIVIGNPRFRVIMPPGGPQWEAEDSSFKYMVCYKPDTAETVEEMIRIYLHRKQPNAGLTQYVIDKPIRGASVMPPPEPIVRRDPGDTLPELTDPTTFRNLLMPTAEPLERGRLYAGNYDVAGWVAGFGVTNRLTATLGSVTVPDFISKLLVVTVGAKYEVFDNGPVKIALGGQLGYSSSTESDITVAAPFAVFSYGDRARRLSIGAGYSWKHHQTDKESFDKNAYVVAVGGDITISRGMKLVGEAYVIESSGMVPVAMTVRWFGTDFAVDAGLGVGLGGDSSVTGTGSLSGEARHLRIAPIVALIWKW